MSGYVLGFQEIDRSMVSLVGGKGANLGELCRIDSIRVPDGFCLTTDAFRRAVGQAPEYPELLSMLGGADPRDRVTVAGLCARIRAAIERAPVGEDVAQEVARRLSLMGEDGAYAVRSSATAEDLPTASFAGQQDTFLNVIGTENILSHIRRCWASAFTDRAVIYRMQNGFPHDSVRLSVVVQKMVFPHASGILFTADPVTSSRKVMLIDASFGLGEALVSGLVDADVYRVSGGRIVDKKISVKEKAVYGLPGGGTQERQLTSELRQAQALSDGQILELAGIGERIQAHFGRPQDIEWCLEQGRFFVVQSRPVTTLYPLPEIPDDRGHVYMSLSHQQMMTDAMSPLGLSFFPMWLNKLTSAPIVQAGGRMYLDVSFELASPVSARVFIQSGLGSTDRLIQNALENVCKLKDFLKTLPRGKSSMGLSGGSAGDVIRGFQQAKRIEKVNDASLPLKMMEEHDVQVRQVAKEIRELSGKALFDFIERDMDAAYRSIVLDAYGIGIVYIMAQQWIEKNMKRWLGEENVVDVLSQSLANNVTTQMGYALMDAADVIRDCPGAAAYLEHADDATFFSGLEEIPGGKAAADAIRNFLEKYGARGPGEIDIMRPRWADSPAMLAPVLLNNIRNFEAGSSAALYEQKKLEAEDKARELTGRLEKLPGGRIKAEKTRRKISVFRNYIGLREYPKFAMMKRFYLYRQALLREGAALAGKGLLREAEDVKYLSFEECRDVVTTGRLDYDVILKRKADQETFEKLNPPRVMTSDGEVISGEYDAGGAPDNALIGIPVSAGTAEGRAKVVLRLEDARIEEGDILVTAFTDPSWTPLFVSVSGLVTEVGGMMTHSAVVAREYGLPAVVSVENATKRISDGQRIRVNGSKGYVEILGD